MARFLHWGSFSFSRKYASIILAFIWSLGLLTGMIFFQKYGSSFSSWMGSVFFCRISIVDLLISAFLPFLFAAFAVYVSQSCFLYLLCYCKALFFSFVSSGICSIFGSAGWLVWILFMFHDIGSCVLLYIYASRHISPVGKVSFRELGLFFLIGFSFIWVEYQVCSPILESIVHF